MPMVRLSGVHREEIQWRFRDFVGVVEWLLPYVVVNSFVDARDGA